MAVRKKKQWFSEKFQTLRLHREDLAAIEEVIKDQLQPEKYQLETDKHEYDGLEDIPKYLEETSEFSITTSNPSITFEIDPWSARLAGFIEDAKVLGVLHQIEKILRAKEEGASLEHWKAPPSVVNFGYAKEPVPAKEAVYVEKVLPAKEPQSFLKRNKDGLIVRAIFAVIAIGVALLIAIYS